MRTLFVWMVIFIGGFVAGYRSIKYYTQTNSVENGPAHVQHYDGKRP